MLVNRQTINCAFAFSCKKFALFELADPMRRKIFVQMFLQGEARLIALQVPKERLSGNLTSIGRMCSSLLCLGRCVSIRTRFFEVFSDITAQKCSQIRKYLLRFMLVLNEKSNQKNLKDSKSLKIRIFQGVRAQTY